MKKLLTILALALTLCLFCSAAMAAGYPSVYEVLYDWPWDAQGQTLDIPEGENVVSVDLDMFWYDGSPVVDAYNDLQAVASNHGKIATLTVPGVEQGTLTPRFVEIRVRVQCIFEQDIVDCTEGGIETCVVCGKTQPIPPMDHLWETDVKVVEETCGDVGYTASVCKRCGIEKPDSRVEVAATGAHTWKWVLDQEVTCLTNIPEATAHEECEVCGEKQNEDTTFASVGINTAADYTMANLNAAFALGLTEEPELHRWDNYITQEPATCLTNEIAYHWCKLCNKIVKDIPVDDTQLPINIINIVGDCRNIEWPGMDPIYLVCDKCLGANDGEVGGFELDGTVKNYTKDHKHELVWDSDLMDETGTFVIGYELEDVVTGKHYQIYHDYDVEDAAEHLWNEDVPRCKEPLMGETGCIRCGAYGRVEVAPQEDHNWGEWIKVVDKEEAGTETNRWESYCQNEGCNNYRVKAQDEKPIDPCKKHDYQPVDAVVCGNNVGVTLKCSVCGAETVTTEEEPWVVNHEKKTVATTAPTCTEPGQKIEICSKCKVSFTTVIPAAGHKTEPVKGKAATHVAEGTKDAYKCTECGKLFEDKEATKEVKEEDLVIAKTPEHDWDNATVEIVKEATCSEAGKKLFTCECGETKAVAIPMIAHTPEDIPAVEPTCKTVGYTAGKKCSECGTVLEAPVEVPVDLTKHVWGDVVVVKAATCEDAGEGLKVCSECKTSESVVIPAIGHDWGEWEITTAATVDKDGEETRVCKNDATHKETRTVKFVPTAPAKYEVKDLDYTNPVATGSVKLDPETKALTKAYARVTFFVANGDCMIQIVDVDEAGNFTAGAIGNFTHVSVIIVDDADAYGAEEAIEHAHGNGGIEL